MKTDLYNRENTKVGTIDLPDAVFAVKWNPDLVHQAVVAQLANARQPVAHTKNRGEVSGGGKKPWRQKHTGRARHGSTRSPLWIGGGITFGPRNDKDYSKKINKKMKRVALCSILSKKLADGEIKVIDDFTMQEPKTKNVAAALKKFFSKPQSLLIVSKKENKNLFLAGRNIPKTEIMEAKGLNVYTCLSHKTIFIDKDSIEQI